MPSETYVVAQWTLQDGPAPDTIEYICARDYGEAGRKYAHQMRMVDGVLGITTFNDIDGKHVMMYDVHNRYLY